MAKGYSFQGLVDSVLMKLNLLSEIKEQGKKAQKEARDNLDVYGKEQTYNKLETDNQISLVVDNAPSTLNTLNKLAQAIDNNPKFAEKLHLLLDQKLEKSDNGADIPDKNLFVKNLGLTERENRWINKQIFNTLISGNIDGNAASATTLQTARKINGVPFNGSADIGVNTLVSRGRVPALSGNNQGTS
ncbi:MAG: hypothetical protein EKE20_14805, partial [Candidatus Symbiopectobacterium sp. Dall1.0]|nr:hypothetical protein [Candidatus Symbiopectobacterium sp. Dall1.0]